MKDTTLTFVEAAAHKIHYTLGLISGVGAIYEGVKHVLGWRPNATFWRYVLAVDWFIGVAVVYTFIAIVVGFVLTLILSSIVPGTKDNPKRKQFESYAGNVIVIIAPIVGIIIAIINKGGPVVSSWGDVPNIILFRLVGFAAIALTLILLFDQYHRALHHKSPAK